MRYIKFSLLCQAFNIDPNGPHAQSLRELLSNRQVVGTDAELALVSRDNETYCPQLAIERASAQNTGSPISAYLAAMLPNLWPHLVELPPEPQPQGAPVGSWPAPPATGWAPPGAPAGNTAAPVAAPPPVPGAPAMGMAPPQGDGAAPDLTTPQARVAAALGAPTNSDAATGVDTPSGAQTAPVTPTTPATPATPAKAPRKPRKTKAEKEAEEAAKAGLQNAAVGVGGNVAQFPVQSAQAQPTINGQGAQTGLPQGMTAPPSPTEMERNAALQEATRVLSSKQELTSADLSQVVQARMKSIQDQMNQLHIEHRMLVEIQNKYL